MKKLSWILVGLLMFVSVAFAGCGTSENNKIRLSEVTHSIFYAPLYVAMNNDYFKDEGLEIELSNGGGADGSMAAILSGDADIGLMGPEASIYVQQKNAKDKAVVFGQMTKRDGSFIVSKTDIKNFTLNDLVGKEIIGGRRGGVPAMTLQYAIEEAGLEIGKTADKVNLNLDVPFNETATMFKTTSASFCTLFEPSASNFCKENGYFIVGSVGELSGEVPYTCFQAKDSFLKNNSLKAERFLRAIYRGYQFLMTESSATVADVVISQFPATSKEDIISSLDNYKATDAWVDNPAMLETSFDRLQNIMINAGELKDKSTFASVVDNKIANKTYNYFKMFKAS